MLKLLEHLYDSIIRFFVESQTIDLADSYSRLEVRLKQIIYSLYSSYRAYNSTQITQTNPPSNSAQLE